MASSPTPSLDSIRGVNSIESYDHMGYLSDSPLTLSGSSPPVSDSAICDEFTSANSVNQHHPISASVSSSSSSSSGLSGCGSSSSSSSSSGSSSSSVNGTTIVSSHGPGVIGSNLNSTVTSNINSTVNSSSNGKCTNSGLTSLTNFTTNLNNCSTGAPRCTACKSKYSAAVAKCFECVSYLCAQCVSAHEFMNCFNGHNVCLIKGFSESQAKNGNVSPLTMNSTSVDFKYSSSLTMMPQQQHQQEQNNISSQSLLQQQTQQPLSQLSKIVLNSHVASSVAESVGATPSSCLVSENGESKDHNDEDLFVNLLSSGLRFQSQQVLCQRHKHELLKFNCRTCCMLACKDCVILEHSVGIHDIEHIQDSSLLSGIGSNTLPSESMIQSALSELREKIGEIVSVVGSSEGSAAKIKMQYQKAHNEVNETYQFFCSMLDERKQELLKELETLYNAKLAANNTWMQRSKELIDKTVQSCETIERTLKAHSISDVLMLRKNLEVQLQSVLQDLQLPFELEFMSNYQSIQAGVRNTFGYIRPNNSDTLINGQKQPPISRPIQNSLIKNTNSSLTHLPSGLGLSSNLLDNSQNYLGTGGNNLLVRNGVHNHLNSNGVSSFDDIVSKRFQNVLPSGTTTTAMSPFVGGANPYEKWSNGGSDILFSGSTTDNYSSSHLPSLLGSNASTTSINGVPTNAFSGLNITSTPSDSLLDISSKLLSVTNYPPKSQIKRQKMIYHCKFGEFGVLEGQFTEPSGVAVNAQNDIIVADTNNHRIQIFDKEGRFKFQFGECGKRDSQLLYPNRVSVVRSTGDIIVTERSPTHQIQIYNQYGRFVRKFGANILQHPRGVTVDKKGRIIVVECKVMRVIIFDQNGNVLHKFGCSKHLEFPNGVVVNDKQEIFISDNRAHCVKVFNYEGQYLRQIGGEGITNYPIGVGINSNGEILIADNHNNFNLTIFTQDGQLVSALESKVKHAQCFDVALMDDGSVVLASKDYRLYIYRYVQVPPMVL